MSYFDNQEIIDSSEIRKREIIHQMTDVEFQPTVIDKPENLSRYNRIPISQIAAAGTSFDSIASAIKYVVSGGKATTGLYHVSVPKGAELMKFKNGTGFLGSVAAPNGSVGGGQAVLKPLACDPTTLFMAVALMNLDKKLDKIQELQKDMFAYIKQRDKAKLRGNLSFLADILNNYKYHWDSNNYKLANIVETQEIKRESEQNIEFYRSRISSKTRRKGFLQVDQQIQKQLDEVEGLFRDYSLALYIHAFASFLEVMLLENFNHDYLNNVSKKIENNSVEYKELYTSSYNKIEHALRRSVQGQVLGSLAKINKDAGKIVGKIPLIEKTQLDESLNKAGNNLWNTKSKNINRRMKGLVKTQSSQVKPFVENLSMIDTLYNKPFELIFDEKYLYLK